MGNTKSKGRFKMNDFNFVVIMRGSQKIMSDYEHYATLDASKSMADSAVNNSYEWAVVYDRTKMEVVYETYVEALA